MIQTKGLTGAQTMLRVLGKMGVEKIFASPGSEWSPLWEAWRNRASKACRSITARAMKRWRSAWPAVTQSRRGNCLPW